MTAHTAAGSASARPAHARGGAPVGAAQHSSRPRAR